MKRKYIWKRKQMKKVKKKKSSKIKIYKLTICLIFQIIILFQHLSKVSFFQRNIYLFNFKMNFLCSASSKKRKTIMINIHFLLFFLNLCFCIKLPLISNVFGSHMVLQREKFVNVWGWSQNDIVTIVLENSNGHIVSNSQVKPDPTTGLWKTQLKPMPGNKEKFTLTISDKLEKQTLLDIVFGEVWLCSGKFL